MICPALLSFAVGVWLLQQQVALPSLVFSFAMLSLLVLLTVLVVICSNKQKSNHALDHRCHLYWRSVGGENQISIDLIYLSRLVLVCLWMLFAGFSWAAWCAHHRLQDRLSTADEGVAHEIAGCIVDLPSTLVAWGGEARVAFYL